jgi:L-fuconolactonase
MVNEHSDERTQMATPEASAQVNGSGDGPVVDAHHHLWDLDRGEYQILRTIPEFNRSYCPAELAEELAAAGVTRTVLVQSEDTDTDTDAMLGWATDTDWIAGVVGWVPLLDAPAAARRLDDIGARLCGIRHLIHNEPDPDWLLQPEVADGLTLLAERGLPFDVVAIAPRHLEVALLVAERHPTLRLVLDHLSGPPIAKRGWQPWADLITAAADIPTITAKVSGLGGAAGSPDWTVDDLRPYVEHAVQAFGPSRLMFGSDWPISRLVGGYPRAVAAARELFAELPASDRAEIFGQTAERVYGLA